MIIYKVNKILNKCWEKRNKAQWHPLENNHEKGNVNLFMTSKYVMLVCSTQVKLIKCAYENITK